MNQQGFSPISSIVSGKPVNQISIDELRKLHTLEGKKGIVFGIGNEESIAYGCALAAKALGAEIGLACYNQSVFNKLADKGIIDQLGAEFRQECNFKNPDDISKVFAAAKDYFGSIDFVIFSAAGGCKDEIQGQLTDASEEGLIETLVASAFPLVKITREASKIMPSGGVILSMGYLGEERVVDSYHYMAPTKAFLASCVKNLAVEQGANGIRINDISPGPIKTRAASGLKDFNSLVQAAVDASPLHMAVSIHDVGNVVAAYLCDSHSSITGETIHVDAGFHAVAFASASVKQESELEIATVATGTQQKERKRA